MRPKSTPQEETCIRLPRVRFSFKAIPTHSLLQACGPHLSSCLTPLCGLIPVIMPGMHELRRPERVFQNPRANEDLIQAQLFWGEEEEDEEEEEVEEVEEEEEEVEEEEEEVEEEEEEVEEVEEEEQVEEEGDGT